MDELLTQAAEEIEQPTQETSAEELLEELTPQNAPPPEEQTEEPPLEETEEPPKEENAPDEDAARLEEYKKGFATLQEDGWTKEELLRFSQDEQVQKNVKDGMTIRQAARAYLIAAKTEEAPKRRRGVPTSRPTALGAAPENNLIENMTDEQFAEFSRRAERAMMEGKKVRFD